MSSALTLEELIAKCESEQLHLSGAIQSFGTLLRIDLQQMILSHVSANAGLILPQGVEALIGRSVDELGWLNASHLHQLTTVGSLTQPGASLFLPAMAEGREGRLDVRLIRGNDAVLLELEVLPPLAEKTSIDDSMRQLLNTPYWDSEYAGYHQALVDGVRSVTGFDRAMIYRFHEDWSGEVIAEAVSPDYSGYLGQRFPASDIPRIARELYLKNPARMIPDAHADPVPLLSCDGTVPDLTWSDLRSVSPLHLQYLRNMGVRASFSIPIKVADQLWGLVTCHHRQACHLSNEKRNAAIQLVRTYGLGIATARAAHQLRTIDSMDRRIEHLLEILSSYADPLQGIAPNGQLLIDTASAHGFALAYGNDLATYGDCPTLHGMAALDAWFLNQSKEQIVISEHLVGLFDNEPDITDHVSGLMAIRAYSQRSGWVRFYWFRREEITEVDWAGEPHKQISEDPLATSLSPRTSFEKWTEIRRHHSRHWNALERLIATKLRSLLLCWL